MQLDKAIKTRRSVRKFKSKKPGDNTNYIFKRSGDGI